MLRGNLKQVRIEKNPARLRALESAAGESEPSAAMALALAGEPAPPAPVAPEDHPDEEMGFTIDIKSFLKPGEKTYTQRCRLFVGNLPTDITEEDFKRLFERYGEPSEVFINRDRGFGFIRLVSVVPGWRGCEGEGGVKGGPCEERGAASNRPRSSAAVEKALVPAEACAMACENRGASRPCFSRRVELSSHPRQRFSPEFPISGLGLPSLLGC